MSPEDLLGWITVCAVAALWGGCLIWNIWRQK